KVRDRRSDPRHFCHGNLPLNWRTHTIWKLRVGWHDCPPLVTLCETLVGAKSIAVTFAKGEYGYVLDAGSNLLPLARHGNEGRAGTHRLRLFAECRQERETRRHRRY